jgi:hypothetical protein
LFVSFKVAVRSAAASAAACGCIHWTYIFYSLSRVLSSTHWQNIKLASQLEARATRPGPNTHRFSSVRCLQPAWRPGPGLTQQLRYEGRRRRHAAARPPCGPPGASATGSAGPAGTDSEIQAESAGRRLRSWRVSRPRAPGHETRASKILRKIQSPLCALPLPWAHQ